jgi:hypothetical protein
MPPFFGAIALACLAVYGLLALLELLWFRRGRRFVVEIGLVLVLGVTLRLMQSSSLSGARAPFGTTPDSLAHAPGSLLLVGLMFVCILLGMAARYLFFLHGPFAWIPFLKPLCVSPIVLLPILGTLQNGGDFVPLQVVCFCLLAFQNGFFWRVVFERAQSNLRL